MLFSINKFSFFTVQHKEHTVHHIVHLKLSKVIIILFLNSFLTRWTNNDAN